MIEVGIEKPGTMGMLASTLRPDVAVILAVSRVHTTAFTDLDQYAGEKATLLESLAPGGLAVLNGDDPRVARMTGRTPHRTCFFGSSADFDVWVDEPRGRWPDRLSFRAHCGNESREIQTRLLGFHWIPAITAALATAARLGIRLEEAAGALGRVAPHTARMDPVQLPNGVVVVRDDYSATLTASEASLQFLREARASRRALVVTDISDSGTNRRSRLRWLAAAVSGWLDLLVLIGEEQRYGVRKAIEAGMTPGQAHGFEDLRAAAEFLKTELRSGDLVLLKGRSTDHATRLFFAQCGTVECWCDYCHKTMLCDMCWELGFRPSGEFIPPSLGARV